MELSADNKDSRTPSSDGTEPMEQKPVEEEKSASKTATKKKPCSTLKSAPNVMAGTELVRFEAPNKYPAHEKLIACGYYYNSKGKLVSIEKGTV